MHLTLAGINCCPPWAALSRVREPWWLTHSTKRGFYIEEGDSLDDRLVGVACIFIKELVMLSRGLIAEEKQTKINV